MKVFKFGGASVNTVDRIKNVAGILHSYRGEKLLIVVDANNGSIIDKLPIGDGCDGVAFDPASKNIYTANGEGNLTVIHEEDANKFLVVENIETKKGARTIALDKATHLIYLPTAEFLPLEQGQNRPKMKPGTFQVLVIGK